MLGDFGFVKKKHSQAYESKDERHENVRGRPRILSASPRQGKYNGSGRRNHDGIATVMSSVRKALNRVAESYIQSTRANFSRVVPAGVGTRRQVNMSNAAAPQIGMLRSVSYVSESGLAKSQDDEQKSHRH
jgi:hypothetical protein